MTLICSGYDPAHPCPVECQSQQLLEEFRTWRDKFDEKLDKVTEEISDWKQDQGERLVKLETVVKPALMTNGQPSQISTIDKRVGSLEKSWTRVAAVGIALWSILTIALHFVPWGHK